MIVGALEGALLIARPYGDVARFQAAAANLLAGLAPARDETPAAGAAHLVGVDGAAPRPA